MKKYEGYARVLPWFMALLLGALLVACGGGRDPILGMPGLSLPNLVSIAVTPATASIPTHGTQAFVATATYSDGSTRDVSATSSWSSGSPGVASVNASSGLATGIVGGTALITATFGDKTSSANLTVTAATLSSIAVTPATATIPISATQQFIATATYSDGSTVNVTATSSWSSGSASVATVNANSGLATGVIGGTALITASFGGKTSSASLTVTGATLVSIAVTPATASVPIGAPQQFTATATYSDGSTRDVSAASNWSSGSASVASVNATSGMTTGVVGGSALITATFGGKTGSATVTVPSGTLTSIAVTPATATVAIGLTQPLVATGTYSDGSHANISTSATWTSGSPTVATVLANTGVVTGVAAGSATITATAGGKTGSATVTVPSATLASIAVTPGTATVQIGLTQPFVATGTYSDGSSANISSTVAWTSSSPAVATVLSNTGVTTGVAAGSATITATSGGKTGSASVIVPSATLSSIAVTPAAATVAIGLTQPLVATGSYSDGSSADITSSVAWTSSSPAVATVLSNTGVTTGVAAGSATITATSGGKTGSATLTVAAAGPKGPAPVALGTAGNFVILAKSGVSTTGTTAVVGDIGVSPIDSTAITGFGLIADSTNTFSTSSLVTGKLYAANYAVPTPSNMTTAVSNMETAYTDAAGRATPDSTELGAGNISGMTLVPGLYKWGTGVHITNVGVTLSGGANDVWIFQIGQGLTVDSGAIVTLSGGAQAKNVFWQVAGQATINTGAKFKGIILSQTLISFYTGAEFIGRALAQTAVTLDATSVTQP